MTSPSSVDVVLAAFDAVEDRDDARFAELCHRDAEFHWPPSLPYGGTVRGVRPGRPRRGWGAAWDPLQPTESERRLDPRVIAATNDEVVVLWQPARPRHPRVGAAENRRGTLVERPQRAERYSSLHLATWAIEVLGQRGDPDGQRPLTVRTLWKWTCRRTRSSKRAPESSVM